MKIKKLKVKITLLIIIVIIINILFFLTKETVELIKDTEKHFGIEFSLIRKEITPKKLHLLFTEKIPPEYVTFKITNDNDSYHINAYILHSEFLAMAKYKINKNYLEILNYDSKKPYYVSYHCLGNIEIKGQPEIYYNDWENVGRCIR